MKKLGIGVAVLTLASVVATANPPRQDETPSLTTDDVVRAPDSVTNANAAAAADEAARETTEAAKREAEAGAAAGYTKFLAPSGYVFERPSTWRRVENLESKGAPGAFKYDAVFQDPTTGAVISAVSVDKSKLGSVVDISDKVAVNKLLTTMLNPTNAKAGVKIFRQTTGDGPNKTKWLRIKAQGTGQATDGRTVDTTFWVQIVQSDAQLALVAVGYPTTREKEASVTAFHTVRTLEMNNVGGSAPAPARTRGVPASETTPKKDGASDMREQ